MATLALTGTAFSQVAGDECSNALAAAIGNNAFDTTTMTPSANPPADGSCTFLDWGASQDVWFSWTASGTGTLAINLCASAYDTSMVVYENDCTTQVACNDDSCGAQYQSVIPALAVTSGTNYKIRIGGWEAASGAGTMNLAFTDGGGGGGSTPGDECA
ncbi:MAG: hypothetical protein O2855_06635, partial [Planctomycetota bacterium]|nr:hypothetical protein [Planctomycetota bacterium]